MVRRGKKPSIHSDGVILVKAPNIKKSVFCFFVFCNQNTKSL